jgi:hypothetical protein
VDLAGFFRALTPGVLDHYRQNFLADDEGCMPTAEKLVEKFSDRQWLRERLKAMDRSHHVALVALLQCRSVAGGTWLLQELRQTHGMSEDVWAEVLHDLGGDLFVFGNSHQSPPLFYTIPDPIAAQLRRQFSKRLCLPSADAAEQEGIRPSTVTNYRHPVGFSLVSFLTYLRQNPVRITRQGEIFKKQSEEMTAFFSDLWGDGEPTEVLAWNLDFAQELGLVRRRAGRLEVDDRTVEEFLAMEPSERRDLYRAYFDRAEPLLGWLLELMGDLAPGTWVPLLKLRTVYRRQYMGSVFHRRYVRKSYYLPPSGFYDPNPPLKVLQIPGLVESGLGAKGSYVRLSEAGRLVVSGDGFESLEHAEGMKYLLQPTFEILAPVGIPMKRLWKLGEITQLKRVDRANTYELTRESVRSALDDGWRTEEMLEALKEGSQVGVPQNVSSTLRDWSGRHGEVELHDALVLTCEPARVKKVVKILKKLGVPVRALAETVLAIPRERSDEILEALQGAQVEAAPTVRRYDLADEPIGVAGDLRAYIDKDGRDDEDDHPPFPVKSLVMLGAPTAEGGREVMAARGHRAGRTGANAVGADLSLKPAAAGAGDLLKLSPVKTMSVVKAAIRLGLDLEVLYPSTGGKDKGGLARVTPSSVREAGGGSYFTGRHHRLDEDLQFHIKRIQGIRLAD